MTTGKIVSFEEERERIEFNKCEYYGSVTIYIKGETFEDAMYYYYSEYLEDDEILEALENVFQSIVSDNSKITEIKEFRENLLNRSITIHYYLPKEDGDVFFYEYEPSDLTENQLMLILVFCILNLKQ